MKMAEAGKSDAPKTIRYVRKTARRDDENISMSYVTDPINVTRRSLIPKFEDDEWELEPETSGAEVKTEKKEEIDDDYKSLHDGFTARQLKPIYTLWKYVGDPSQQPTGPEKAANKGKVNLTNPKQNLLPNPSKQTLSVPKQNGQPSSPRPGERSSTPKQSDQSKKSDS